MGRAVAAEAGGGRLASSNGRPPCLRIAHRCLRALPPPTQLPSTSPQILLLDEATSALDAQSEVVVQQALSTLMARPCCPLPLARPGLPSRCCACHWRQALCPADPALQPSRPARPRPNPSTTGGPHDGGDCAPPVHHRRRRQHRIRQQRPRGGAGQPPRAAADQGCAAAGGAGWSLVAGCRLRGLCRRLVLPNHHLCCCPKSRPVCLSLPRPSPSHAGGRYAQMVARQQLVSSQEGESMERDTPQQARRRRRRLGWALAVRGPPCRPARLCSCCPATTCNKQKPSPLLP